MRDKTYFILKLLLRSGPLREAELARYTNKLTTIDSLVRRKLIYEGHQKGFGEPDGSFHIADPGLDYIRERQKEAAVFRRDFFSQFASGFAIGVLTTVVAGIILFRLGIPLP